MPRGVWKVKINKYLGWSGDAAWCEQVPNAWDAGRNGRRAACVPTTVDRLRAGWRVHSSGNTRGCETPRAWLADGVGRLRMANRCAPAGGPPASKALAGILAVVNQVAGAGCIQGATRGSGHGRPGSWST